MKYYIAILCFIAFSIPVSAQQKMYIKIDGIDGESPDLAHKNWIDAYAYSGGLTQSGSTHTGGGGGAGKANFQDYTFTICLDKSVNAMKVALAKGTHIPSVTVEFVKDYNGYSFTYSKIKMETVLISSIIEGASTDINKININVSFNYAKLFCTYRIFNPGDPGNPKEVTFGWDVATIVALKF